MNVSCIFSDDFREEAGGKYSFIGVYANDMFISTPSFIIPKLSVAAIVKPNTASEQDIAQLSLEIRLDGKSKLVHEISPQELKKAAESFREKGDSLRQCVVSVMLTLFPVRVGNVIEAIVTVNGTQMLKDILTIKQQ